MWTSVGQWIAKVFVPLAVPALIGTVATLLVQHVTRHRAHSELLYKRRLEFYPEIYWRFLSWVVAIDKVYGRKVSPATEVFERDKEFHNYVADKLLFLSNEVYIFFQAFMNDGYQKLLRDMESDDLRKELLDRRSWLFGRMRRELGVGKFMKDLERGFPLAPPSGVD